MISARRWNRAILIAAFGAAVLSSARSGNADEDGTSAPAFGDRSLHVLHVPFLDFGPADPTAPAPGRLTASAQIAYASTFSSTWHALTFHKQLGLVGKPFTLEEAEQIHRDFPEERVFFLASDLLRISSAFRVGISPTLSVTAELVYVSHDAVHGGSAVEAFHRAFGLAQSGRDEFPSDSFAIVLQRPHGDLTFDDRVPSSGLGDTTATVSWRPERTSSWRFGVDAAVKAPTGRSRDLNGSGSWDAGALGFARRDGPRWAFDSEIGVVVPGKLHSSTGLSVAPFARLLLGATLSVCARTRLGASATLEQSPFRREALGDVSHPGLEIALGVEHDFRPHWSTGLTLTENVPSFGDRADFGLALRIRFR